MFKLPNGKYIDQDMVEMAMQDNDFARADTAEEIDIALEEIDASSDYVPIERISSHKAYQWMEDFVAEIVAPKDERAAEKLSIALMGKGAF